MPQEAGEKMLDYRGGFAMNLADTVLRMRYRNSWTEPEFMAGGGLRHCHHPAYDEQLVPEGPSHQGGRVEQQLPTSRGEPQHR